MLNGNMTLLEDVWLHIQVGNKSTFIIKVRQLLQAQNVNVNFCLLWIVKQNISFSVQVSLLFSVIFGVKRQRNEPNSSIF